MYPSLLYHCLQLLTPRFLFGLLLSQETLHQIYSCFLHTLNQSGPLDSRRRQKATDKHLSHTKLCQFLITDPQPTVKITWQPISKSACASCKFVVGNPWKKLKVSFRIINPAELTHPAGSQTSSLLATQCQTGRGARMQGSVKLVASYRIFLKIRYHKFDYYISQLLLGWRATNTLTKKPHGNVYVTELQENLNDKESTSKPYLTKNTHQVNTSQVHAVSNQSDNSGYSICLVFAWVMHYKGSIPNMLFTILCVFLLGWLNPALTILTFGLPLLQCLAR